MLKKLLLGTIIVASCGSFFNPTKAAPLKMEAEVTADFVNLREEPGEEKKIITSVKKTTRIQVLGSDSDNKWILIKTNGGISGWVPLNSIKTSIKGKLNYQLTSNLGLPGDKGILNKTLRIANNGTYTYVIDYSGIYKVKIYDSANNFVKSHTLTYPWLNSAEEQKNIFLTCDENLNFYTNSEEKNTLTVYDFAGNKQTGFKKEIKGNISQIYYDNGEKLLYILDDSEKTIKVFEPGGKEIKNIFLGNTRIAKKFSVNNRKIYVIDYPENENIGKPVYYVNSFSFSFREAPLSTSRVSSSLSRGSIIDFEQNAKIFPEKYLLEDNISLKINTWIEFSEQNGKKSYALREELKKVELVGEIDIYDSSGLFLETFILDGKWTLTSTDRHRDFGSEELLRKINGIMVDPEGNIVLSVLTSAKKQQNKRFNLNFYYLNRENRSYRISKSIPWETDSLPEPILVNNNILTVNNRNFIEVLDENGLEKETIGRLGPISFNLPNRIYFHERRIFIFDEGNYALGEYDLNGEVLKTMISDQSTDLFRWEDVFFTAKNIFLLKSLQTEEKKLGIEVFDYNLKKIADKWLMSTDGIARPMLGVNEQGDLLISANGEYYGKKMILSLFDPKMRLLNSWKQEKDLNNAFPENILSQINQSGTKIIGFDNQGNIYLLMLYRNSNYKINQFKISREGKFVLLKSMEPEFFGSLIKNEEEEKGKRFFGGSITGEVLRIFTGKNGFTYFLYRETNEPPRIGIYDPTGTFWQEFGLIDYPETKSLTLDENENLWITEGTNILKLETE